MQHHERVALSDPVRTRQADHHRHHPWRVFSTLTDWTLEWTDDLPDDTWGRTVFADMKVFVANGLDQAGRRCTIAHETQHILRGPAPVEQNLREELITDRRVSRLLVPSVRRLGHALSWHHAATERVADELWVDEKILDVRMAGLTHRERTYLDEQLATVLV